MSQLVECGIGAVGYGAAFADIGGRVGGDVFFDTFGKAAAGVEAFAEFEQAFRAGAVQELFDLIDGCERLFELHGLAGVYFTYRGFAHESLEVANMPHLRCDFIGKILVFKQVRYQIVPVLHLFDIG